MNSVNIGYYRTELPHPVSCRLDSEFAFEKGKFQNRGALMPANGTLQEAILLLDSTLQRGCQNLNLETIHNFTRRGLKRQT